MLDDDGQGVNDLFGNDRTARQAWNAILGGNKNLVNDEFRYLMVYIRTQADTPPNITDLADEMKEMFDRNYKTVTSRLAYMERLGYISRQKNKGDKRKTDILPTQKLIDCIADYTAEYNVSRIRETSSLISKDTKSVNAKNGIKKVSHN